MNEQERRWEGRGSLKILSLYWLMAVGRCCCFSNYMGTLSFTSARSIRLASVVNIHLERVPVVARRLIALTCLFIGFSFTDHSILALSHRCFSSNR